MTNAQEQIDSCGMKKDSLTTIDKEFDLSEVTVVARVPLVHMKTDKMTYEVKNDADSKTQTILQMLRKVPMVTVDGKNNITVNGSREFKVYVDGRLNTMITRNPTQVLRNMPASGVQSIEVITNPGARYDAEGVGGVLNIITKKKKNLHEEVKELSGTISTAASINNWGINTNISGQRNRFSFDMNIMADYTYIKSSRAESTVIQKGDDPTSMYNRQDNSQRMPFLMGEFGMGYQLDSVSALHLNLSTTHFGMKERGTPSYLYSGGMYGEELRFQNHINNHMSNMSYDGNIDYQRFFGADKTGSMTITYQFSHNPMKSNNTDVFFNFSSNEPHAISSRNAIVKEKNTSHHLLADFVVPLNEKMKLNTGIKLTTERNTSNSADERTDHSGDNVHYKQHQSIVALYGEYEVTFNWLSVKPGLRYEHTWQKTHHLTGNIHNYQQNYGELVPSFLATATLNENQNIGINYNMRIRRPRIEELDPYKDRSDPSTVFYGNPNLDAEKTHNISFVYTLTGNKFSMNTTLRHSFSKNDIQQYSFYEEGLLHTTFGNVVKKHMSTLNVYINWNLTKSTRMLLNAEVGYSDLRSQVLNARNHGWSFNANYGIQQNLPWNIKLTTNLELMTRDYTLQGWESGMSMLSASLAKSFYHDKWNITVTGTSGIGHGGDLVWKQFSKGKDFESFFCFHEPMKNISIGISYNFGGKTYEDEKIDVSLHQRKKRR